MHAHSDPALASRAPTPARPRALARRALIAALLALPLPLATGCSDRSPPAGPSAPPPAVPGPQVPQPPAGDIPPLARPADVFVEAAPVYGVTAAHAGWLVSRFVLYGDGRFGLQFSSPQWGFHEYGGRWTRTGSEITFDFDGASIAGPWQAIGTLGGERLTVTYNDLMALSDFVDGTYVRVPGTP